MISVLVIDDDFRVARVHAGFTEQVAGFRVVGNAHTAAEARAMVHEHRPDLVLLDVYLPDESGITLLSELDVDTMVLSAASDPDTVRAALRRGALNYLVKPFPPRRLADRLTAYARYRTAVARGGELSQVDVDRAVRFLREGDLPEGHQRKGQSPVTARLVGDALRRAPVPRSAAEIASDLGIARATAQRYLAGLAEAGRVRMTLRYGATGRPEHLYQWRAS